ncbi:MAG: helix-hairpin-helix domain-containing protein [Candidatus Peribacter sp.]
MDNRDSLNLIPESAEPDDTCRTFEEVLASKKLHQYLKILRKAGVLNVDFTNDDDLMEKFLANPQLQTEAEKAWGHQPILTMPASRLTISTGLAYHIRSLLQTYLLAHDPFLIPIRDLVTINGQGKLLKWPWQICSALTEAGYVQLKDLEGLHKRDLMDIPGIGETYALRILEDLACLRAQSDPHKSQ